MGKKIGEYARRKKQSASNGLGPDDKGKGKAKETNSKAVWENCETTDENAVVFEAYQVSASE